MVEFNTRTFSKVTNIASAAAIVFVAIYKLVKTNEKTVNQAVVSLYYLFFAILVVAAEFRLRFITNLFGFLSGQMGRGFFILMCGSLFLSAHMDITVIIGIILIIVGVLNMLIRVIKGDQFRSNAPYRAPSAQNQGESQKPEKPVKAATPKKAKKEKAPAEPVQNDQPISDGPAIRF